MFRKNKTIMGLSILLLFVFTASIGSMQIAQASDASPNPSSSSVNERSISITIDDENNVTTIQSISESNLIIKNGMMIQITYDQNGMKIILEFVPQFASVPDFVDLKFEVTFTKIIEYEDGNENGVYDVGEVVVSEVFLNEFEDVEPTYGNMTNSEGVTMHNFTVKTTDGVFAAHTYISDGLNESKSVVITPNQMKFDFEINYVFLSDSSRLALETLLKTPTGASGQAGALSKKNTTQDERFGYATNEQMIQASVDDRSGYFSWRQDAVNDTDDEIEVLAGDLIQKDGTTSMLYLNYPNASFIYHDPKIGTFGTYSEREDKDDDSPPQEDMIPLVILLLIVAAIGSIGVIYLMRKRIIKSK